MPELPEVETVARGLAQQLCGRRTRALEIFDRERLLVPRPGRAAGREIRAVLRVGKRIAIELVPRGGTSGRPLFLVVHLRMTGRLLWEPAAPGAPRRTAHLRARLRCEDGEVRFIDPRRFGELRLIDSLADLPPIGLDPTQRAFTPPALSALLTASRQPLKPWLLRQDRLVGLGNIYASEILFAARLCPTRAAGSLDEAEVARLHGAIREVLRAAIRHCGTTISDYADARGARGEHQRFLAVYGRDGEPCPRCAGRIRRTVQQQRSTYHCPRCQRRAARPRRRSQTTSQTTYQPSGNARATKEMTPWRSARRCRTR